MQLLLKPHKKVNKILTILLISILTLACHRRSMPSAETVVKDSTSEKVSVTRKDSTFSFPKQSTSIATTIDSLLAVIKRLMSDTAVENKPTVLKNLADTVGMTKVAESRSGTLRGSLWANAQGNLLFNCNSDSLKAKISWLEYQLKKERYMNSSVVKQVPVEVPTPYIPKWIMWVVGVSLAVNAWFFRKPIAGLIKHIVKPW